MNKCYISVQTLEQIQLEIKILCITSLDYKLAKRDNS